MNSSPITFADFLSFKRMITPVIIKVLFWIGIVVVVFAAFGTMFGAKSFLAGLFILVIGPLAIRVYCEILILLFMMNDTLTDIRNTLSVRETTLPPTPEA